MSADEVSRTGGCLCGAVRYSVRGEPYKSGLCHCTTCRQVTGSAFLAYADWRPDELVVTGRVETYRGRSFCPTCGSRLFSLTDTQAEIYLGSLDDAPNGIAPIAEGWIKRREPWQHPVEGASQNYEDPHPFEEDPDAPLPEAVAMRGSHVYRRLTGDDVPADAVVVSISGATEDDITVSVVTPAKDDVLADEEA